MIIYYVNSKSTIKGPYDITDSHQMRIMKIGDICIRESLNGMSLLLICSTINKWSECLFLSQTNKLLKQEGNTLLFSFDGTDVRKGNLSLLQKLSDLFDDFLSRNFFLNAIEILNYKCDMWNAIFYNNIKTNHLIINCQHEVNETKQEYGNGHITMFETYLSDKSKDLFKQLHIKKSSLRTIYQEIRNKYPEDFRNSLQKFLEDNPNANIYQKINS